MLFGTDVCVRMVLVWEETGVLGGETHLPDLVTNEHLTCRRRVSNPSRSGESRVRYHCANQTA